MAAGWNGDRVDVDTISWSTDEEEEEKGPTNPLSDSSVPGPSRTVSETCHSHHNLISYFVGMGFSEEMVANTVKKNGKGDKDAILEMLLTYVAIEGSPFKDDVSPNHCSIANETDILDADLSDLNNFGGEGFTEDFSEKDRVVSTLVDMGFLAEEACSAIDRCGLDASIFEFADSIHAARMSEESDGHKRYSTSRSAEDEGHGYLSRKEKRRGSETERYKKRNCMSNREKESTKNVTLNPDNDELLLPTPNPMERADITERKLPQAACGPPYFYFENVARVPKGVLYNIEPEFVDSKFFSVISCKRGYIHNLPIINRFRLLPIPPKIIHETFPTTKNCWPKWDPRTQLNSPQTWKAAPQLTARIGKAVTGCSDPPPRHVRDYVLSECQKWNLIWVGHNKVATLEPDEIETILGFPRHHTRGGGISLTDRYKSMENSFQIDTLAYHLSVLKNIYRNGINVLSLFSGIGGAEVALHRLGVRLKTVVSAEMSEINRKIMRSWWEQTNQNGNLIQFAEVQELNADKLKNLINTYGQFDLVIGGSPCDKLVGSNGHTPKHSYLSYDYIKILDLVKGIKGKI